MEFYVRIEGFEHVLWTQQESTGTGDNRRTRTVTYQDQSQCANYCFKVMQANNDFGAGQFSYPIQF